MTKLGISLKILDGCHSNLGTSSKAQIIIPSMLLPWQPFLLLDLVNAGLLLSFIVIIRHVHSR